MTHLFSSLILLIQVLVYPSSYRCRVTADLLKIEAALWACILNKLIIFTFCFTHETARSLPCVSSFSNICISSLPFKSLSLHVPQKNSQIDKCHLHMVSHHHLHLNMCLLVLILHTHTHNIGLVFSCYKGHCLHDLYYRMHLHYETIFSLYV